MNRVEPQLRAEKIVCVAVREEVPVVLGHCGQSQPSVGSDGHAEEGSVTVFWMQVGTTSTEEVLGKQTPRTAVLG